MKRIFSIISVALLLCLTMTACNGNPSDLPTADILDVTIYGQFTSYVNSGEFNKLTATVTTTTNDGIVLTSIYVYQPVGNSLKIEYLIEKLGQFEKVDGVYTKPENMIELIDGSVIISGGKIASLIGDEAPFDISSVTYPAFQFKEAYFSSPEITDTEFSANVIFPGSFMGMQSACSNMKIIVTYDEAGVNSINLSYNGAGETVVAEYIYE